MERNNEYLEERMYNLWENNFSDIPRKNFVLIKFGKKSYRQLGSIKLANKRTKIKNILKNKVDEWEIQDEKEVTVITITGFFADVYVPDYVIDATIAHEMIHYAHGFHSPLQKRVEHPHKGNVIKKEMSNRGLLNLYINSEKWLKNNWTDFINRKLRRNPISYA